MLYSAAIFADQYLVPFPRCFTGVNATSLYIVEIACSVGDNLAVVVPLRTWKKLLELLEDLEDVALYDEAKADPDQELVEYTVVCRELGHSPLRYLRNLAGLTQEQLAKKTGLSQSFIARVEQDEKKLSESSKKKIARVLKIKPSELG